MCAPLASSQGVLEKQTSCYFQAVTALSYIAGNIYFNGPRAAINQNDGYGGGNVYEGNLAWGTCLESQDHGVFNSCVWHARARAHSGVCLWGMAPGCRCPLPPAGGTVCPTLPPSSTALRNRGRCTPPSREISSSRAAAPTADRSTTTMARALESSATLAVSDDAVRSLQCEFPSRRSRYNITGNFFVYGGHKNDFDGHQKVSHNNLMAFSSVYGPKW